MSYINKLVKEIHQTAKDKGWWNTPRSTPECIALMHSELSESLEEYRLYGDSTRMSIRMKQGKPEGTVVELADTVIRIMDLCGARNWDLEEALRIKLAYNKTRSFRHGNKKA